MENWLSITLIISGIVLAIIFCSWLFGTFLEAIIEIFSYRKSIEEFKVDLVDSLKHSQPDWEAMTEIARTRDLTQSQIQPHLRALIRDIRTGKQKELAVHLELILTYTNSYKNDEPFEALPSDIRLHLERVRDKLSDKTPLEPLTTHIKELVKLHTKENRRLRFYTIGGFFIGLVGVALAVVLYVSPLNGDPSINNKVKTETKVEG